MQMANCMSGIHCWHPQHHGKGVEFYRFYCCNCGEQTSDLELTLEQGICTTPEYFEQLKQELLSSKG